MKLKHLITLLLVLIASSPGAFADKTADYGYIFVGTCTYNGNGYTYDGWIDLGDGSFMTPELDLSNCTNPELICGDPYSDRWVSSDGVNFTLLAKARSSNRATLPKDTRFVKMVPENSSVIPECVVIEDLAYGPALTEVIVPEFLSGIYNADDLTYTLEGEDFSNKGHFRFNMPSLVTDKTVRYLQVVEQNNGISLSEIRVRCKSGKELSGLLAIDTRCYLLPSDAESVEVLFTDMSRKLYKFQVRCKGFTTDITNQAKYPSSEFEKYFDIDGDGMLECIIENKLVKPVQTYNGVYQFIAATSNQYDRIDNFMGLNSDGVLYGEDDSDGFLNLSDISNPKILHPTSSVIKKVTTIDYNLDGQTDYYINTYSSTEHPLLTLKPDGSTVASEPVTMTPEEYAGVRSELQLTTGGDGVPGMGDMFGRDGVADTFNPSETVDINSDGLPDFLDAESGAYLLNLGDGRFVKSSFGNRVVLRDFDGDGVNDILIWEYTAGNVKLYNGADTSKEPLTLFTNLRIAHLYCRDVDRDGDVDVVALIHGGYYANNQDSYVLISENQGGNKFRRREHFVEGGVCWIENSLVDLDADGKYELLGRSEYPYTPYMVRIVSPSEVSVEKISDKEGSPYPVKVSANGSWMVYGSSEVKMYPAGTRPAKPSAPTLHYNAATRRLTVSWTPGTDVETSTVDLTYELRIGTAPGSGDIAAAQALPDGTRRCLRNGANGYSTVAVYNVDSWPEGKVYISCQTIDADFSGSEFSEPAVFEKTAPACDFVFTSGNDFATWLEVGLELAVSPAEGTTYRWDFADAEVLGLDNATMKASIRFATAGTKEISLTARSATGEETTVSKTIDVAPVHLKSITPGSAASIDIDGDGYAELFRSGTFYKENADGELVSYKKSFNTNTGISTFHVADVDCDGFADVFDRNNYLMNYGDGDMEKVERTAPDRYAGWQLYDFNNDGKLDEWRGLNSGDFLTTADPGWNLNPKQAAYGWYGTSRAFFYDFNGDGLIDIAYLGGEPDPDNPLFDKTLPMHIFENIDGYSFKPGIMIPEITREPALIDDLDGDGLADYVFCDASYNFGVTSYVEFIYVRWGSGSESKYQCPDGNPFQSIAGAFDFNNDGMKDLAVSLQNSAGILTISPVTRAAAYTDMYHDSRYSDYLPKARLRNGDFITQDGVIVSAPNERPLPPSGFRSSQNELGVVIEWNPGSDKETPVKGLRYNISVKHKGKTGEGAYLISPLNGGNASIPLPWPIYLPTSPKFTIPMASIPAGEYEVSVQTVDGQNDASEFSEVYALTVRPQALAKLPTSGMVGQPVELVVLSNTEGVEINFGSNVKVEGVDASHYNLTWSTEGVKQISINGEKAAEIYIYPAIDATFTVDPDIYAGALVAIENIKNGGGKWEYSVDGSEFKLISDNGEAVAESRGGNSMSVRFLKAGTYVVRHTISESYGAAYYDQTTMVKEQTIEIARISAADRHFKIEWDVAATPERATMARIYKETSVYNTYEMIGEAEVSAGEFIDLGSDAAVKTARYKLSFVMPYGETALSAAHQPMHVQVNRGLGSAINLVWSRYEGLEVESYRILKGTSPDNMEVYDTLSGNLTSYSDVAGDAAGHCYSIEMVQSSTSAMHAPGKAGRSGNTAPRSNVVWGRDAIQAVLATSIVISPVSGGPQFDGRSIVSLQARVLPANASITQVNWEVVEGSGNMEVDIYGNVSAKAFGKGVVRATAVDGSGISGEIELDNNEILLTWIEFTAWPSNHEIAKGETFQYQIKTEPTNASEKPVWESSDTSVATVTQNGLVEAVGIGETTISVRGKGEGMFIDLPLRVTYPEEFVHVDDFDITPAAPSGAVGEKIQFKAIIIPENATEPDVLWSVEPGSEHIVEIDETGVATILGEGEGRIRATLAYQPHRYLIAFIYGTSGIDDILAGSDGPWSVYTVGGVLLIKDATRDDIHRLQAGFYIIGGKPLFLSGK